MNTQFRASFATDIRKIKNKKTLARIKETLEAVEDAQGLHELAHVKKLKGEENYYRIKIGDYRIGLVIEGNVVFFVRCLNRKDIYRFFP
jgi:mRNA interferase RelE/StbE